MKFLTMNPKPISQLWLLAALAVYVANALYFGTVVLTATFLAFWAAVFLWLTACAGHHLRAST